MKFRFTILLTVLAVLVITGSGCKVDLAQGLYIEGIATNCDAASAPLLTRVSAQSQLALEMEKYGETFSRDFVRNHRTVGDSEAFTKLLVDLFSYVKIDRIYPIDRAPVKHGKKWTQLFCVSPSSIADQLDAALGAEEIQKRIKRENLEKDAQQFREEMQKIRDQQ